MTFSLAPSLFYRNREVVDWPNDPLMPIIILSRLSLLYRRRVCSSHAGNCVKTSDRRLVRVSPSSSPGTQEFLDQLSYLVSLTGTLNPN